MIDCCVIEFVTRRDFFEVWDISVQRYFMTQFLSVLLIIEVQLSQSEDDWDYQCFFTNNVIASFDLTFGHIRA